MTRLAAFIARLAPDPRTDGELLRAFRRDRDEAAFAEVVRRHGPAVWGACRRALPDPADAEDAFQATFLVLVRRGPPDGCLAAWLYRVAALTSRGLRRRNARRRTVPLAADPPARPDAPPADVDALLLRLPERERAAVVLCLLHGLTQREAAGRLGVPEGTLSARLSRGLARLRAAVPAAGLTAAVPAGVAEAAVAVVTAGRAAGPGVGILVAEVTRMFVVKKLTTAGLAVALVAGFGVGLGVAVRTGPAAAAQAPPPGAPKPTDDRAVLREMEASLRILDDQEQALADQRSAMLKKINQLRAKLDPKLAGPAFEFTVDRKDTNGPIRLDERDKNGRVLTRTYFPSFRLDDIGSIHHALRRAAADDGPTVLRITSDRVPWDGYANSVVAASHDCGYFPEEEYGKKAEALLFLKPKKPAGK